MSSSEAPYHSNIEHVWAVRPNLKRWWAVLSAYNLVLGALLWLGGYTRVASATFALVRELGGPTAWGIAFMTGGAVVALAAVGGARFVSYALILGAVVHGWFAAQFVVAAFSDERAALTGGPTYLLVAIAHAIVATSYRTEQLL